MAMQKMIAIVSMVLLSFLARESVQAQTLEHRLEISGHYTVLALSVLDSTQSGIGGRMAYNINDHLAVEGEGNFFPEDHLGNSAIDQKAEGLIGVKAGVRKRRVGIFAKLRPGVVSFPSLKNLGGFCIPTSTSIFCDRSSGSGNRFALDVGGVIEFYPSRRMIVRVDLGDTLIRFKDDTFFTFPTPVRAPDGFSHNFQGTVGLGFRF